MDTRLGLMCGIDLPIPECKVIVHQPKIKEIAHLGEKEFFIGVQTLCLDKKFMISDKALLETTNNFQIFMTIMSEKQTADKKIAVQQLFQLIFPNYKLSFTPRTLILSSKDGMSIIDESNFEYLQSMISSIFCLRSGPGAQDSFNPADEAARKIAEKLMRGRKRVAEQKGESDVSILSQYISILTIGIPSMSLQNLMDLTIYQLYDLIERYNLYVNWDIDIKSRLAGAKPENKPDNWMKNIH